MKKRGWVGDHSPAADVELTPTKRIDAARAEIVEDVQTAVLERIAASTPLFFERLVLKLLTGMGYAGTLGKAEHAGRSGDGGIDGILYLDRLQLERV
jgi:restriction system protein